MSDEREAEAGAPVEETEASVTDVQAAVDRASEVAGVAGETPTVADPVGNAPAFGASQDGPQTVVADAATAVVDSAAYATPNTTVLPTETAVYAEQAQPTVAFDEPLPTAGPVAEAPIAYGTPVAYGVPAGVPMMESPVRDGEIRISPDHPMAGLYMQSPMPPEVRGNRGAGVLIALLATVGFAIVLAGAYAAMLAPNTPPSRFVDTLVDVLTSWGPIFAVGAFFVGMAILVLIVGRAGWWAYVLGGFLVAVLTGAGAMVGSIVQSDGFGGLTKISMSDLFDLAFFPIVVIAFIIAREASIWFGAWIGSRGRRVTRANADAVAEYESALAGAQAKQP